MDYPALRSELDAGHPDTGAYNVDDLLAAGELNAVNRTIPRTSMNGDEIFAATDNTEFLAATESKQQMWVSFTSKDIINAYATTNINFVDYIFGAASTTKATLATLRTEDVSRATEISATIDYSGPITVSHVAAARAI